MGKRSMRVSPKHLRVASEAILVKLGMGNKSAQAAAKVLIATAVSYTHLTLPTNREV